jgi:hypothetical protein
MDERILSVTENLMRRIYKLRDSYKSTNFSVKNSTVSMTMSNGLITVTAVFPRTLIEDNLDVDVEDIYTEKQD